MITITLISVQRKREGGREREREMMSEWETLIILYFRFLSPLFSTSTSIRRYTWSYLSSKHSNLVINLLLVLTDEISIVKYNYNIV